MALRAARLAKVSPLTPSYLPVHCPSTNIAKEGNVLMSAPKLSLQVSTSISITAKEMDSILISSAIRCRIGLHS